MKYPTKLQDSIYDLLDNIEEEIEHLLDEKKTAIEVCPEECCTKLIEFEVFEQIIGASGMEQTTTIQGEILHSPVDFEDMKSDEQAEMKRQLVAIKAYLKRIEKSLYQLTKVNAEHFNASEYVQRLKNINYLFTWIWPKPQFGVLI